MTIRVFVGTEPAQVEAEVTLEYSIRQHTSEPVEIVMMRAGEPPFDGWVNHGPTGFTLFRFAVPELCDFDGWAIYLDCDMLVLDDIANLSAFGEEGCWVTHPDREGDCVSVIDCSAVRHIRDWPSIIELRSGRLRKWDVRKKLAQIQKKRIPDLWNSVDRLSDQTRLIHFSNLRTQPWQPRPELEEYQPHPDQAAVELWQGYHKRAIEALFEARETEGDST